MPIGHIPHADLRVRGVQNVGPVAAGVHPAVHNGLRCALAVGDVLTGGAEGQAKGLDHLEGSAVSRIRKLQIRYQNKILR